MNALAAIILLGLPAAAWTAINAKIHKLEAQEKRRALLDRVGLPVERREVRA